MWFLIFLLLISSTAVAQKTLVGPCLDGDDVAKCVLACVNVNCFTGVCAGVVCYCSGCK